MARRSFSEGGTTPTLQTRTISSVPGLFNPRVLLGLKQFWKSRSLLTAFVVGTMVFLEPSVQGQQYQVLHQFLPSAANPYAGLIQGSDGNFYGTTQSGGTADKGTVFKMDPSGVVTTFHSFTGSDGAQPQAGLIQGSDGNFYGTTVSGGAADNGTVFKLDSSGVATTLHSFAGSDGAIPVAGLIEGSDGNFYGTTFRGGASNNGTVFKMDSSGAVTTLHSFAGQPSDGALPYGALIQRSDGNFYGSTQSGGTADKGTVFKIDSSGAVTTLHSFAGQPLDGAFPYGGLIQGSDGNFYGTTQFGGPVDDGTVFKMDASGSMTMLHFFAGQPLDGAFPYAGLIQGMDGNFYGTTVRGGASGNGTVFKMDASGIVTALHSFAGGDGANPTAQLVQGSDGNFYGTTLYGGTSDKGTVFKMDSSGSVTTLHSFGWSEGAHPDAGLIQGSDGNFYGTTRYGGTANNGTVFKMDSPGAVTPLHSFAGSDGTYPQAGLSQGNDGNFYGATVTGGAANNGTVFKMDASGALTTLYSFTGQPVDGALPYGRVIRGSDDNFYGTTLFGGSNNNGTVFKMDASGAVTTLHSFGGSDGTQQPRGTLLEGSDGNFYGTTQYGGPTGNGTIFKMDASGAVTILYSFAGPPLDGAVPRAGLIQGRDGNFYGTTQLGGTSSNGTVFKMDASGTVTILHSFAGSDGAQPYAAELIQASDGSFYGTTVIGGAANNGTAFKMDASGAVTTLHSFAGQPVDGAGPTAGLIQGSDRNFYGTTYGGGTADSGTVFRLNIPAVHLLSVVSRKAHGSAGTFDVVLPLMGNPGIECRSGGANNDYMMVFTFANPLTSVSSASVTSGSGSVSSSAMGSDTHQYIVNLTGVSNAQLITVSLTNVNDASGNFSPAVAGSMGVLLGDTSGDGVVNSADITQTRRQSGNVTDASNFREDVTLDGVINSADITAVRRQSGTALP